MEILLGVFLRVIIEIFFDMFKECVCWGDVIGVVGYLVFMVIVNGGVVNIFVVFLVNYVYFLLVFMVVDDKDGFNYCLVFVLECLVWMLFRLVCVIGIKVCF